MDINAHSIVSVDDYESFFSIDLGGESSKFHKGKTTARSQSEPGFLLSQLIGTNDIEKKSELVLPSRVNSDSLIDLNVVLQGLSTVTRNMHVQCQVYASPMRPAQL